VRQAVSRFADAGLPLPAMTARGSHDHAASGGHDGWSTIGLPVERRHDFQVMGGWEHWSDHDLAEWADNGTEQAAEIIASGVSDKAAPTVQIGNDSCAELRAGSLRLTGTQQPPHGLTLCADPRR
jgi:hypothetical protein